MMRTALNGHYWSKAGWLHAPADWELESELEYWDREIAAYGDEHAPTGEFLRLWREDVSEELDRRKRVSYARARQPFADLGPVIAEVKQRADLLAIFGSRLETQGPPYSVNLRRRVIYFRCFYHVDNHPSLAVYREQQRWHCYSCGNGGDQIAAVMKIDNLDFVPAVLQLAAEHGIDVPKRSQRTGLVRLGAG